MNIALLTFTPATIIGLVTEPDAPILFKAAHFALVDRADSWSLAIVVLSTAGLTVVTGFLAIELGLVGILTRQEVVFHQPGQGNIGPFEQVLAAIAAQRDLADKASGRDIAGIPGSGRFGVRAFGLGDLRCSHDTFSF